MKGRPLWNRKFRWIILELLILEALIGPIDCDQMTKQPARKNPQHNVSIPLPTTNLVKSTRDMNYRREIPEAMLDPYSVLGVLSFGVYIFYILYTRYRMRGHHNPSPQNGAQQPQQGGGALFSADAQENIANIIKMATKIISNTPYLGASNSTFDSDDYFDVADASDLRRTFKFSKK